MRNSTKLRIQRLKKRNEYSEIRRIIKSGMSYKNLTDEQKNQYCLYRWGAPREVVEEVNALVGCDTTLELRPPKLSDEKKHIAEVTKEIEAIIETERDLYYGIYN